MTDQKDDRGSSAVSAASPGEPDEPSIATTAAIAPPAPPPRGRTGVVAATAAGVIAASTAVGWLVHSDAVNCLPAAIPGDVLPAERRISLARVLPDGVLPRVETWMTGWSAAAKDVCAVDRDDATLRARRDRCLADALAELRLVLDRWKAGAAREPLAAHTAAEELPVVRHCSHAVQQSIPDPTALQALQIVPLQLRRKLATSADEPSRDAIGALAGEARAIGYAPLAIDLAVDLASVEPSTEQASRIVRGAIALADANHLELAQIQSRIALAGRLGGDAVDEAVELADTARTLIAKIGGEPNLEAILDFCLGRILQARNQYDKAAPLFERSARRFRAAHGPDSLHEAQALVGLGGAHAAIDPDGAAARAASNAARAIYRRAHVTMPMTSAGRATPFRSLGAPRSSPR